MRSEERNRGVKTGDGHGQKWFEPKKADRGSPSLTNMLLSSSSGNTSNSSDNGVDTSSLNPMTLQMLLASAPVGFALVDPELCFVHVNQALAAISRQSVGDHLGRSLSDILGDAITQGLLPLLMRAFAGEVLRNVEVSGSLPDAPDKLRHFLLSFYPVRDAPEGEDAQGISAVTGVGVVATDITAHREAEMLREDALRALQESEERFHIVANLTIDAVWDWDLLNDTVWWNEGIHNLFGYPTDTLRTATDWWYGNIHPDDQDRVIRGIHQVIEGVTQGGSPDWSSEYRFRRANGSYADIVDRGCVLSGVDGAPVRMLGGMTDVTERKQWEEQRTVLLRQQQRIAETLQRSLQGTPRAGGFPGLTLATYYEAASEEAQVGGDFYDVFAVDDTRVALVVGDVTGKGLDAATATGEIKYGLRILLREQHRLGLAISADPAIALTRLNDFLFESRHLDNRPDVALIALSLVVLETHTGRVAWSSAGAEPPLLWGSPGEDGALTLLGAAEDTFAAVGPLLGAFPDAQYPYAASTLPPGGFVLLTTDGITEARVGRSRRFFKIEGLTHAVRTASKRQLSPTQIVEYVVREAKAFGGGAFHDDVCLLMARREAEPS